MEKPGNVKSCDMTDSLVSCVAKYCELAKVSRECVKLAQTPFHENKTAKPVDDSEPQRRVQPRASRVLTKVLLATRMARRGLRPIVCLRHHQLVDAGLRLVTGCR